MNGFWLVVIVVLVSVGVMAAIGEIQRRKEAKKRWSIPSRVPRPDSLNLP